MPPIVATLICAVGILGLFLLDRDRRAQVSPALWVPFVWVAISASRNVSQWLGLAPVVESPDFYLEGNPVDRLVFTGLLLAGLLILLARGQRTATFLRANWPLLLFFLYCLVSILWSDFPLVSFKRWIKTVGSLVMVLVVLTDDNPSAAVKRLLTRVAFLLIPFSVVLNKYYPALGRSYHRWSGEVSYQGVATGKNELGALCLLFGLFSLWCLLGARRGGERPRMFGSLAAHATVLAIGLWLLWMANSMTSLSCFLAGVGLLAVTSLPRLARKPAAIHLLVGAVVLLSFSVLFLDVGTGVVEAMGRDATLTGRTEFWAYILEFKGNPWIGTGFDSYWLGERAEYFWENYWWRPNQAHNGYLEVYITLGWIGVALHCLIVAWGYRNAFGAFRQDPALGRLKLTYFVIAVIYNLTEAAFRAMHPIWIVFLLGAMVVPKSPRREEG